MTERTRLVRKYLILWDRWNDRRMGKGEPVRYPWAYRAGLSRSLDVVRARIDMIDKQRLAA